DPGAERAVERDDRGALKRRRPRHRSKIETEWRVADHEAGGLLHHAAAIRRRRRNIREWDILRRAARKSPVVIERGVRDRDQLLPSAFGTGAVLAELECEALAFARLTTNRDRIAKASSDHGACGIIARRCGDVDDRTAHRARRLAGIVLLAAVGDVQT